MVSLPLTLNEPLWRSSRLPVASLNARIPAVRDAAVLLAAGIVASLSVHLLDFSLKIPGHAILRSILPVTLGMALVPRRLSGTLIGASGLTTTTVIRALGMGSVGWGAFTSLLFIGPVLDAALWRTRSGWTVYLRCALAGLVTNLLAFGVRGGTKAAGWDSISMIPLHRWWSVALVSHVLCGLIAGLLCALLFFRWNAPAPSAEAPA